MIYIRFFLHKNRFKFIFFISNFLNIQSKIINFFNTKYDFILFFQIFEKLRKKYQKFDTVNFV